MPDAESPLLELETRRRIYDRIRESPGLHFRALQRDLGIPLGTLEYNLYQMERQGLVVAREDTGTKSFFPNDQMDRRDRDLLHYLRQRWPRAIALEVTHRPGISFKELRERLGILPSALSPQLKRLVQAGLLTERPEGRTKVYECPDADRVRRIVIQYRRTFVDTMVDRFADAWVNL